MTYVALLSALVILAIIVIAILNHRIKIRMIKRGLVDETTIKTFNGLNYDLKIDALKWGLILFFGGAGLILLNYITYQHDSTLPYGIEIVFLSAGFITYYLISKKINSNS
jgi:hypothetical protein